ncbi:LuxR C-terminal-related transcriptional regulator [Streptomyces sp. NBC_00234]|uniref:LuxR C-terminal-related transcriptional regulator n=1 Tax=Streptomyces sp. NBC_00234 TaxID=2903638 RepID=UPI002E297677|nr:LuxR C-terminal-related transcriptional regulator [Streptomyces sp. NBC_00234]
MTVPPDVPWAGTGLGPLAGRVLECLVTQPELSSERVAEALGATPAAAEHALRALENEHLVVRVGDRPSRWSAGPPRSTLGSLLARRRQELARAELYMEQLHEAYRSASHRRVTSDLFEVVESAEQVGLRYAQLLASSRHEVLHLAKPPYVARAALLDDTSVPNSPAAESDAPAPQMPVPDGVRLRSVYDTDGMTDAVSLHTVLSGTSRGGELRLLAGLPMKLVVFDATAGIMPLRQEDPSAGSLIVHSATLLAVLTALFESVWQRATPVSLDSGPGRPPITAAQDGRPPRRVRDILSLMSAGMTDDAIARVLGLSRRTIQKHISETAELLGARTRFQIALLARERSWLGDASDAVAAPAERTTG